MENTTRLDLYHERLVSTPGCSICVNISHCTKAMKQQKFCPDLHRKWRKEETAPNKFFLGIWLVVVMKICSILRNFPMIGKPKLLFTCRNFTISEKHPQTSASSTLLFLSSFFQMFSKETSFKQCNVIINIY